MPERINSTGRPGSAAMSGGRRQGITGKPIRFEDVRREGWYFKDLPQNVAEAILKKQSPGHFLVTQLGSVSTKLYLVTMRAVKSFEIETLESDGKNYYRIGKGLLFASIQQLVDHYRKTPGLGIMLDKYPDKRIVDDLFALQTNEVKVIQPLDLRLPWDVRFGHWRKCDVIIQQCRENQSASDDQKALFNRHSKILMAVKHENISCLLGCGLETPRCFLVTESLSEGALIDYLHRNTMSLLLRPNDLLTISRGLCKAMEYLEDKRIVHNELAAENCVIDELCRVKLTGFHLSRYEGDYESLVIPEYTYKVKTPPPEFYQNNFSCRSDVWSFGFLLWTVFKRGQDESFDIDRILNADWGTRLPITIINRARHLIASCLVENPVARPRFKEILPFLHEENFPGPPYRFREYSSEEATASSAGEASQDDEPKAKIVKVPAGKTKFPSMNNLSEVVKDNKPSVPPRATPVLRGEDTSQSGKDQRRSHSAMQAPIPKMEVASNATTVEDNGQYSRLRPQTAFKDHQSKSNSPHRSQVAEKPQNLSQGNSKLYANVSHTTKPKHETAPHMQVGTGQVSSLSNQKTAITAKDSTDSKSASQDVPNPTTRSQSKFPTSKPPPSPARHQVSHVPSKSEELRSQSVVKKDTGPVSKSASSTPVHITPMSSSPTSSSGLSNQSASSARFGFDRSTPKPDTTSASLTQASAITGSAINVHSSQAPDDDEPSTFMEYDVSSISGYTRAGSEVRSSNTRHDLLQDEDIIALKEMLDYATERIEFTEQTRLNAIREKNLVVGEISKTELKCMTEVEELSRMFFKHIQDMHTRIVEQDEASTGTAVGNNSTNQGAESQIQDDVRIKRLNEMKLRGRIAMRQLKQELKQIWTHNRDLMTKIVMLSHSNSPAMPLQDRSIKVDNSYEAADNGPRNESNSVEPGNQSARLVPQNLNQKSPSDLPESEAPVHVLEFLRKFLSSKDVSILEKEQVRVLFKALDQAYNDQQRLQKAVQTYQDSNQSLETSVEEKNAKSAEQLQEYKYKVSKLRSKLATIMDENSQLKSKVESLQQIVQKANNVVEVTRIKIIERDQFEQKCLSLEETLKRVESEMSDNEKNFRRTLMNLKQELREALDGKKQFENEINNLLMQKQSQGEGDQKQLMSRLQQVERERMEAEARAEALAENLKYLTKRMEAQEMQVYHGKATIESLRREIEVLQRQTLNENSPQYKNMTSHIQTLEAKLQNAEKKISELSSERDQFKFLHELSLQKLRAQDEKPKLSKAQKKLMKQSSDSSGAQDVPKKTSALSLLEKKFLRGSTSKSNSTPSISGSANQNQVQQATPFNNPAYAPSTLGGNESERTSLNSSATGTSSSGAVNTFSSSQQTPISAKLSHRPKLISPRIAKSPVPPPINTQFHNASTSEATITPISPGKLKGKWQAL